MNLKKDGVSGCRTLTGEDVQAMGRQLRFLARLVGDLTRLDPQDPADAATTRRLATEMERITGGRKVAPGDFAECCLIGQMTGDPKPGMWHSTGCLIHPRVVITAKSGLARLGDFPNAAAFGIEDQCAVGLRDVVQVDDVHEHPELDLSALVLRRTAPVAPVDRATVTEMVNCDQVELVGFGNDDPAGLVGFGEKRQVSVPVNVIRRTDMEDLANAEAILGFDSKAEFVAGRKGSGKDSPQGDTGGPAFVLVDGVFKLAGVTSRASNETGDGCGDGGVYLRLDAVEHWIDEVLAGL